MTACLDIQQTFLFSFIETTVVPNTPPADTSGVSCGRTSTSLLDNLQPTATSTRPLARPTTRYQFYQHFSCDYCKKLDRFTDTLSLRKTVKLSERVGMKRDR